MKFFKIASLAMIGALAGVGSVYADPAPVVVISDVGDNTAMGTGAVDPESVARANWRATMGQNSTPGEGCFHASYPSIVWESVDCKVAQPRFHPEHVTPADPEAAVTGNGNDFVAEANGLITLASGGFAIKDVTSVKSVGVAEYKNAGILGANEYSVQLNTNDKLTTSACAGHSGCHVWQQFLYMTDYNVKGLAAVLMQYWLLDWGSSCPSGWALSGTVNCYKNSAYEEVPDVAITDLDSVALEGTASAGGNDSVVFLFGSDSYSITGKDSVLDISSVWDKAGFNVVGDTGGSRANFNSGASINVTLLYFDGSTAAPTCVANDGTTGESNNLTLGTCAASGGIPNIQFNESD
jgi:hypothetical protein